MNSTNSIKFVLAAVIVILPFCIVSCERIEPGYVGIKVNQYGNQKGVEDFPLLTGRVWYIPWTQDVYKFPTFMQTILWEGENAVSFNSKEGATITADLAAAYTVQGEKVPRMFIQFRQDLPTVSDTYLRTRVKEALNFGAGSTPAVNIFGDQKFEVCKTAKEWLNKDLEEYGFVFDFISFQGSPRGEPRVMESINLVIQSTQQAIQAENKVKQVEAEAKQEIAKAEGKAQSIILVAEADAKANKLLIESITPAFIQYKMLEKWDGVAPRVLGGDSSLLLQVPMGNEYKPDLTLPSASK